VGKFVAKKNSRKLFILAIIFACLVSVIPIMGFMIFNPEKQVFKVKYVKGYGENLVQSYSKGEKLTLPTPPTRNGFIFLGWTLSENGGTILNQEIYIDKEITLYAKWEEKKYVLNYSNKSFLLTYSSEFILEDECLKIKKGDNIEEIKFPKKDGFKFVCFKIICNNEEININEFSIEKINSEEITLVPVFEEVFVNYSFKNYEQYKIKNISHQNKLSLREKLSFEIVLDESVNQSNIKVETTSGIVVLEEKEGFYSVEISKFDKSFEIEVLNIELNEYEVVFNNNGELVKEKFKYGQNLSVPKLEKGGYKLIGFKDEKERYYYNDYIVHSDLELFAVWEEEIYKITFPRTNGMFVVFYEGETLTTSKEVLKKYGDKINFGVKLSNAYSNSKIKVIAKTEFEDVEFSYYNGIYSFEFIYSDIEIVVENIELNSYSVIVDGTKYGDFGYGSWLYVDGDKISIKNVLTGEDVKINTLIEDDKFGGWVCNNQILVNCIVQDVADNSLTINIQGQYSKKVAKVKLVPNGGSLDEVELIIVEGEAFNLPSPTKFGYKFAGWFVKLIEINTVVDEELSIKFDEINNVYMVLYAGWTK